jgi:hypothetical protein
MSPKSRWVAAAPRLPPLALESETPARNAS